MAKNRLVGLSAVVLVIGAVVLVRAGVSGENLSAKKIFIKDKSGKRLVQVQSADAAVQFSDAADPATTGATLHLYSVTDDFCATLPAGGAWKNKKDKKWVYKNRATKDAAQIKDGKLLVTIKSGVGFTLADDGTQGTVNARVQFGTGPRFCLRCPGNKKDEATKFLGKDCAAAPCDAEPSACNGSGTTTTTAPGGSTTTTPGGSTTTTTLSSGVVLKGALTPTVGRFNYNLTVGLPGADSACNTNFPGTHACTITELQNAEAAGDLDGLRDIGAAVVTGFWAIDPAAAALQQCVDDAAGGSNLNWEYATAHTPSRGQKVPLDNATGVLGAVQSNLQCTFSGASWVGCCL
jgi:hypothetical protein